MDLYAQFIGEVDAEAIMAGTSGPVAMELCASAQPEWIEVAAADGSEEKLPGFSMLAYTGSAMRLEGFYHPVIVDLSGAKANGKVIPIYRQHDPLKIVGHGSAEVSQDSITAAGVVSADNEHAREVVTSSRRGFPWQASIGASVERMEFVKAGDKTQVNGKTVTGPVLIARQSLISEISFVPRGADRRTSAKVAAQSVTLAQLHAQRSKQ